MVILNSVIPVNNQYDFHTSCSEVNNTSVPSLSGQSERSKNTTHCFSVY